MCAVRDPTRSLDVHQGNTRMVGYIKPLNLSTYSVELQNDELGASDYTDRLLKHV